ncbi:MAG: hypothetical protein SF069_14440 [Phycisphaerae bacterium]|nr:hypothetical protein [Phycisphaerae bacterium]
MMMDSDRPNHSTSRTGLYLRLVAPLMACAAALGLCVLLFCALYNLPAFLEPLTIALLIALFSGLVAIAPPAALAGPDPKRMAAGILGWLAVRPMVGLALAIGVGYALAEPARRTMWLAVGGAQMIFLAVEAFVLIRFSRRMLAARVEVSSR